MTAPYYQDDLVTLYLGDCREVTEWLDADALLMDPPYGIDYNTGAQRESLPTSIAGDKDTTSRDEALALWGGVPPCSRLRVLADSAPDRNEGPTDLGHEGSPRHG